MKVLKDLSLLLMLFCISSLVACSSDEEGNTDNPNIPTEFTPSQASTIYFSNGIDFGANAGEQEITFTSNKSWSVSSTVEWCRAVSDRGSADDGSFRIVVDENPSYESREGVLTLKVGELNNYITVRQGGAGSAKIHVAEAGTLPALLGNDFEQITDLTLTGELNGTDFKFMEAEGLSYKLEKLNLKEARIVAGGEPYLVSIEDYYTETDKVTPYLFSGYGSLKELELPASITSIRDYGFPGLAELTSLEIPETVDSIGKAAFGSCIKLERIELPEEVDYLGDMAFLSCSHLKQIELPRNLSYIGQSLFRYCGDLQSVEIPLSVDSIAMGAFLGCESLTKLVIPESVQYIGSSAWSECSSLTTLEYHTKVIPYVYSSGHLISEIIIGEEVEEIESLAFSGYTELRTLTIPATVKKMGNWIFGSAMESLHMLSSTPPEMDYSYPDLGDVSQCTLYVPHGAKARYESVGEPWTDFKAIIEE